MWLTSRQAAERLGISLPRLRKLGNAGRFGQRRPVKGENSGPRKHYLYDSKAINELKGTFLLAARSKKKPAVAANGHDRFTVDILDPTKALLTQDAPRPVVGFSTALAQLDERIATIETTVAQILRGIEALLKVWS